MCNYDKSFLNFRFEVNETITSLTLVAYRSKGTYGNVSLLFYAQNLEAQQGLDYNTSETVSYTQHLRSSAEKFADTSLFAFRSLKLNQKQLDRSSWTLKLPDILPCNCLSFKPNL